MALYPEQMKRHIVENHNALAWGLVPTSAAIRDVSVDGLVEHFEKLTDHLSAKAGIDKQVVLEQAIITPSCGTGSMEVADADRVFKILGETGQALRAKYGF